jgi:hypothetical protein
MLKGFKAPQPPTVVFFEGIGGVLEVIKDEFSLHTVRVEYLNERMVGDLESNRIYFAEASLVHDMLVAKSLSVKTSVMILGRPSKNTVNRSLKWKNSHIILEDLTELSNMNFNYSRYADQVVPLTSFIYESDKFLSSHEEDVDVA